MTETNIFRDYFDELSVTFINQFNGIRNSRRICPRNLRLGMMSGGMVERIRNGIPEKIVCPFAFFSFPGLEYQWRTGGRETRDSFCFDLAGPRAERITATLRRDFPSGYMRISDPTPFRLILDEMMESFYNHRPLRRWRLPLLAEEFLVRIYSERLASECRGKYEKKILAAADAVFQSPGDRFDLERHAAALGITPVHYRRIFKAMIGLPPYEYLQKCRLGLAIRLLRTEKQLQIQQIAEKCGFGSAAEFSRFFRKHTFCSPSNYFKKHQE